MLRQMISIDRIIGTLWSQAQGLRAEWGGLMEPVEYAVVIEETLSLIGVPADGIRLILGDAMEGISDKNPGEEPVSCQFCQILPAKHLIVVNNGWRLACHNCADGARANGLQVITPQVEELEACK